MSVSNCLLQNFQGIQLLLFFDMLIFNIPYLTESTMIPLFSQDVPFGGSHIFFFSHFISFVLFCFCPDFQKLDALELSGFPTLRRIGKQMMAGGGGWGKSCVLSGRKSSYLVYKTEPCWGRKATWRGQGTQLPCMVQTPMAHASFSISYLATAMSHLLRYVPIDGIEKMAA